MSATLIGFLIILMLSGGCHRSDRNEKLIGIEQYGDRDSRGAYDSLLNIDRNDLSMSDKMLYDLLHVKLADKAFITHKTDSLILPVIRYYSASDSSDRYTEALYYGGRVYSDIGDYPSALEYYGAALDRISNNRSGKVMKGKITAQMAEILRAMRLNEESWHYIEMAIEIDRELNDTLNLMFDLETAGINNKNRKIYDKAEEYFHEAQTIASRISPENVPVYAVYLAGVKMLKEEYDSALYLIGDIPYRAEYLFHDNDDTRQLVYSYASDIYKSAGLPDSAYKYALKLISIDDARNLRKGYAILLSNELKDVVPLDSIRKFALFYETLTQKYMNSNGDRNALIQNSLYNYSVQKRDKLMAIDKKKAIEKWFVSALILILTLVVAILFYRDRSNRTIIKMQRMLANSRRLIQELRLDLNDERTHNDAPGTEALYTDDTKKISDLCFKYNETTVPDDGPSLRKLLINDLKVLCNSGTKRDPLSAVIAESQAYSSLRKHIDDRTSIPDKSPGQPHQNP